MKNRNPKGNGRMAISAPRDGGFVTGISIGMYPLSVVVPQPGAGLPAERMSLTRFLNESRASSLEKITEQEKSRNREETLAALEGEEIEKPLKVESGYRGSSIYSTDEIGRHLVRQPRPEASEDEWQEHREEFQSNVHSARATFGSVARTSKRGELNWGILGELNQF